MSFLAEKLTYPSANGRDTISAVLWHESEVEPRGIMQIVHGMCEYMGRYEEFARFLTSNGIIVCGNDHIGHGASKGEDGYGYFAKKDGDKHLVTDVRTLNRIIKEKYLDTPIFMIGHSLGSFITRSYISDYGDELSGIILSGTAGTNPFGGVGLLLSRLIITFKGAKYRSKFLNKLASGNYNERYKDKRTIYDWITSDTEIVDKYAADERCAYVFTAGGYYDIIKLLSYISSPKWAGSLAKQKPYLIFSGTMDPVGNYGKGVREVYDRMKAAGCTDITLKFYENGRHEMLNEVNRKDVYNDVLAWINSVITQNFILRKMKLLLPTEKSCH